VLSFRVLKADNKGMFGNDTAKLSAQLKWNWNKAESVLFIYFLPKVTPSVTSYFLQKLVTHMMRSSSSMVVD